MKEKEREEEGKGAGQRRRKKLKSIFEKASENSTLREIMKNF